MSLLKVNEVTDLAGVIPDGVGRIVQIVRATDTTDRSTTSTSFVDASISVTITPQESGSVILLIWSANVVFPTNGNGFLQLTDSSNNSVSGAEGIGLTMGASTVPRMSQVLIGRATPATTSAVTYKGRFRRTSTGTLTIENSVTTGQIYAIEVAA